MIKQKIVKQSAGFKKIYSGYVPTGWSLSELSSQAEVEYGIGDPLNESLTEGVNILSLPNINRDGEFKLAKIPKIEKVKVKKSDYLLEGDLLFNWRNGSKEHLGKTAYFNLKGPYTHVGFLLRIRVDRTKLDPQYLRSFINFLRNNGYFLGAKIQVNNTFNKEELNDLPVIAPLIVEQKAIVKILSTWDKTIESIQQLIEQKDLFKQALMQKLFTGKKRYKDTLRKWKHIAISEFAKEVSLRNGKDHNLVVLSCTKYDGLVPSLEYFGRKIYSDDLSTYKIVPKNHFAYATNHIEEGSIGYQSKYELALISPMYTVFKTNDDVNDEYLFRVLKSHNCIHEYRKRMEGSIDRRGGLRWDEFSKIKIYLPQMEEQNTINMFFNLVENEITLLKQKLELLREQKKGLMQKLLTGEIRVKV